MSSQIRLKAGLKESTGQYQSRISKQDNRYNYILDIDPKSFEDKAVYDGISNAKTIFVNAVMGFTPHFTAGSATSDNYD